jgi:hypothetical protein
MRARSNADAGHAHINLIYGMHHCLNIVTEPDGHPAAVLIRALEPLVGIETMRERWGSRPDKQFTNGPGRLCQAWTRTAASTVSICVRSTHRCFWKAVSPYPIKPSLPAFASVCEGMNWRGPGRGGFGSGMLARTV